MSRKISQMTEATTIKSGDISVVVQDGETKQFPLDLLATKAQADEYKADVETQLADYEQEITNIKNQYDKELYTPTITVTNTSMVKTGQGDTVDYSASVEDGVVKSAILKGSTKYRDIDTGEFLETFEEGRNLELVSVRMPVLTTSNEDGTKTNILTVNEDVTLRSNGSVYDELDLLTSKLTQRIDEDGEVLAKEVIKTVVLNPSGTLASETPYMWKNGSIQLSSDGLVPGLDYAVTTSRVGVIETNVAEIIANEKRIHTLEVMLAQSTITAAADVVSLQSDLESTTMSVDGVDLDTENTQDNFLYEMILLLIEKDAYDESLFDKVCAFYLYGKLSDEQFTNIYNLLYPVNPEEE